MLNYPVDVSLDYKISQMLVVGFSGQEFSEELTVYTQEYKVGGFIFFNTDFGDKKSNISSPTQLKALVNDIKRASTVLPFISVDQEGGMVARLNADDGFPATPTHGELSRLDVEAAGLEVYKLASTLSDMGFNLNFAPVVDVLVNPSNPVLLPKDRVFSGDVDTVVNGATSFVEASAAAGITSTLKHFPGHGSSLVDSHLGFTDVSDTYQYFELLPFRIMIEEGYQGAIMTAHVFNRNVDPDYPASLSKVFVNDLLKETLGFKGLVITDDLGMHALSSHWTTEEILVKAINAGNHVLVYSNNLGDFYDTDYVRNAIAIIKRNVESGVIPLARIDEAYALIQQVKETMPQ